MHILAVKWPTPGYRLMIWPSHTGSVTVCAAGLSRAAAVFFAGLGIIRRGSS